MIDFRYHLVSLASVLIALAIGIVLGAGPLKEGISESLNSQVVQLRAEKQDLRTQLDAANSSIDTHQSFDKTVLPAAVAGRLADRTVVVVALPNADSGVTTSSEDTLGAAGASLQGPVQIGEKWTDTSEAASSERAGVATTIAGALGLRTTATGDDLLNDVLGATLLTKVTDATAEPAIPEDRRRASWDALRTAGLVAGDYPSTPGSLAVVIGAPEVKVPTATSTGAQSLPSLAALAGALDAAGTGAVLTAQIDPKATDSTSVIAAARGESALRQRLSTVDDAGSSIGQISIVWALVEQAAGRVGQYGLLSGARAVFPSAG
ncbi:MAG TPA: copper transporter [Tetrasphaera sp.]|uniref:Copper transporter n=1 Tax=Nostocoides vanveenii TaxID=330835 RepID=A0ABP4WVU9_9MICO|nr:copper transporter [Tetrasphaera sp.]HNQ08583.1 copper transporter [Tetrasphaera sp.]